MWFKNNSHIDYFLVGLFIIDWCDISIHCSSYLIVYLKRTTNISTYLLVKFILSLTYTI